MLKNIFQNQSGSTLLLMTVLTLSSILLIALSLSAIMTNGLRAGTNQVHSAKAFFAAEAGAEKIMWQIRKIGYNPGNGAQLAPSCVSTPAHFCFADTSTGLVDQCTNGACTHVDYQSLSNNSIYMIGFEYVGLAVNPTIIRSNGSFNGELNRVVELTY